MKVKMSHMFLTIILIVLILLTMTNSCVTFKPHYSSMMNYSTFETFRQRDGMSGLGGSTVKQPANSGSLFSEMTTPSYSKEGFVGLEPSVYGTDKPIDRFSGTPGSVSCDKISSGLSNSKGGLCLTDEQTKLLRTRGGNASGGDSQIG